MMEEYVPSKLISKYLEYLEYERKLSSNTLKSYLNDLKDFDLYFNGNLEKIDFRDLQKYISSLKDKNAKTVAHYITVINSFYTFLVNENVINENPCLNISSPKIPKKLPTYLKQDEIEKVLESIPRERKTDKRNYCIILIASRLGLRFNDIINIKLKDIDWKNNIIKVNQNKNHNLNILPLTKEVGWSIIDYIKNGRPICDNEYLFVKHIYPFEQLEQFTNLINTLIK